jgi:hypothetical protein
MEKTWEIREQELRGEIAQVIELAMESMLPPVDDAELAAYKAAEWCVSVVRGTNADS